MLLGGTLPPLSLVRQGQSDLSRERRFKTLSGRDSHAGVMINLPTDLIRSRISVLNLVDAIKDALTDTLRYVGMQYAFTLAFKGLGLNQPS